MKKTSKIKCDSDIIMLHNKYGKLTKQELKQHPECVSYEVIKRLYGTMENALLSNNLSISIGQRKNISKQRVVDDVLRIQNIYGYVSKQLYSIYGGFNTKVIRSVFGSYTKMYEELNLTRDPNYYTPCPKALEIFNHISVAVKEQPIFEKSFDWLVNPASKKPLYLDAYYSNSNLAIEYHGRQHYEYVEFLHNTFEEFRYIQFVDEVKASLLESHGIRFIPIPFNITKHELNAILCAISE